MIQDNAPNLPVFKRIEKNDCCGCEACVNICPLGIIKMHADREGFFFPFSDANQCVKCEKCVSICPIVNKEEEKPLLLKAYAGYALEEETVLLSSSGGLFTIIAREFIRKYSPNGYVVAVVWNDDFKFVYHICSNQESDIERMRGSKYIQSRKGKIYNEVKEKLNEGAYVLFVGCPCEVAALKRILGKDYSGLYTIDLVCKGSTSEKILSEFLDNLENKKGSLTTEINMRYVGWDEWIPQWIKIMFKNGKKFLRVFYGTDFGRGFYIMQRMACYQCLFSYNRRASDLTFGDYHGAVAGQDYYNSNGTSVVIVNTLAGEKLLNEMKRLPVKIVSADYKQIAQHNPCVIRSAKPHELREKFSEVLVNEGLHQAVKETYPLKEMVINRLPPKVSRRAFRISKKIKRCLRSFYERG